MEDHFWLLQKLVVVLRYGTAIVEKRINDFERIIDNDLYAYVDKALILEGAIYVNYGSQLSP